MVDNRFIYIVVASDNPEIPVGNCYIYDEKNKPKAKQMYIDMENGREMEVQYKYLCRRYELDDPEKKAKFTALVNAIKNGNGRSE